MKKKDAYTDIKKQGDIKLDLVLLVFWGGV